MPFASRTHHSTFPFPETNGRPEPPLSSTEKKPSDTAENADSTRPWQRPPRQKELAPTAHSAKTKRKARDGPSEGTSRSEDDSVPSPKRVQQELFPRSQLSAAEDEAAGVNAPRTPASAASLPVALLNSTVSAGRSLPLAPQNASSIPEKKIEKHTGSRLQGERGCASHRRAQRTRHGGQGRVAAGLPSSPRSVLQKSLSLSQEVFYIL